MKKFLALGILLLCVFVIGHAQFMQGKLFVKLNSDQIESFPEFRAGERTGDFSAFPGVEELLDACQATALFKPFKTQNIHLQHIYELHFLKTEVTEALIEAWMQLPFIEYAEQIPLYEMHHTPNDLALFQWGLPMVKAQEAWDLCRGNRNIRIAIVDDAMRLTHEDLAGQIWTNPGEIPNDSIDNDGNGFIDDVNGYDIANQDNDANPPAGANNNLFSHGTHTGGIAGATTNNNKGIASLAYNVSLVPIKVKEDTTINDNFLQATFAGVDYAIKNKFEIVNMSFGSNQYNFSMYYLVQAGHDSGLVFIASAGNTGTYAVNYPSAYDNVISVGSTDFDDRKSGFSTWHYSIDVMAPGGGIYSSVAGGDSNYGFKSGTSMSAPFACSLAALLLSADSTLSAEDLEACMKAGADNIDSNNSAYVGNIGAGRINAYQSLLCIGIPAGIFSGNESQLRLNRVFPNPANESLYLSGQIEQAGPLTIEMIDLSGRKVATVYNQLVDAGEFSTFIRRPEGLANGVYFLRWEVEGVFGSQKIVWQ